MGNLTAAQTTTAPGERDCWRTPPALFARLTAEYGPFDLDAAAEGHNALCPAWLGPGSARAPDALAPECAWGTGGPGLTRAWCNPPYSLARAFVGKARAQADRGIARTTLLLPATTGVRWWHQHVLGDGARDFRRGVAVAFLPGRVRFLRPDGRPAGQPRFDSVVVTFFA